MDVGDYLIALASLGIVLAVQGRLLLRSGESEGSGGTLSRSSNASRSRARSTTPPGGRTVKGSDRR